MLLKLKTKIIKIIEIAMLSSDGYKSSGLFSFNNFFKITGFIHIENNDRHIIIPT
jgi:hypothetical protein